jgi:hypothetical protein
MEIKIWTISISSDLEGTRHFLFTGSKTEVEACAEELYIDFSQTKEHSPDSRWEINELTPDFLLNEYNCLAELQTV